MTGTATFIDRLAALILGLVLLVLGAAMIIWTTHLIDGTPVYLTAPGLVSASSTAWWPWAVTASGVVLVLLGLRWLATHRPARRAGSYTLADSNLSQGCLSADLGSSPTPPPPNCANTPRSGRPAEKPSSTAANPASTSTSPPPAPTPSPTPPTPPTRSPPPPSACSATPSPSKPAYTSTPANPTPPTRMTHAH